MNKIDRWLDNVRTDGLKQALRFILYENDPQSVSDHVGFIKLQIEEFSRMYPEYKNSHGSEVHNKHS